MCFVQKWKRKSNYGTIWLMGIDVKFKTKSQQTKEFRKEHIRSTLVSRNMQIEKTTALVNGWPRMPNIQIFSD